MPKVYNQAYMPVQFSQISSAFGRLLRYTGRACLVDRLVAARMNVSPASHPSIPNSVVNVAKWT
jgi:hypothetical protein